MAVAPVAPATSAKPVAAPEVGPRRSFREVLEAAAADPPPRARALPRAMLDAARGIEEAQRRLDTILEASRRGRTFTAQELLALQTSAYRFTQTVDIAARLVEHGAQTVKQALNTQL